MLNYQRVLHPFPTVPHGSLPCLFSSADGGDGSAEADGIPTGLRDGGWGRFHCRSAPICKGGCQRQRYMMIRYDKSWYIHIYSKISGYMNYIWYTMYIRTYIYIYMWERIMEVLFSVCILEDLICFRHLKSESPHCRIPGACSPVELCPLWHPRCWRVRGATWKSPRVGWFRMEIHGKSY
jgi:hypothetical protein